MTNLYFVRHGATVYNAKRAIQGQCDRSELPGVIDMSLSDEGRIQASSLVSVLRQQAIIPDYVLSSSLKRASETGQTIAEGFSVPFSAKDDLREMFFGKQWEGMESAIFERLTFQPEFSIVDSVTEAKLSFTTGKQLREAHKSIDPQYDDVRHPGGESKREVRHRVKSCIAQFVKSHPEFSEICIPSHNATLRFLLGELAPESAHEKVDYTEVVHFKYESKSNEWNYVQRIKNRFVTGVADTQ